MESPPTSLALKRSRLLPPANDGASTTRRPRPLLAAAVYDVADFSRVDVRLVDVSSGAVAARLDGLRGGRGAHLGAAGGLVCLVGAAAVRLLDPATGAATDIATAPGDTTPTAHGHGQRTPPPSHVFGHVPATGEYKLLRIHAAAAPGQSQSCEILTLVGEQPTRWRPAASPPAPVAVASYRNKAVARGVAHFLPSPPSLFQHGAAAECDAVASFDLAAEAWRPSLLRGPLSSSASGSGGRQVCRGHLSLAVLSGGLAMVHHDYYAGGCIDVWMLADVEKGTTWVRTHSLRLSSVLRGWDGQMVAAGDRESLAQPLAVMEDGRIALWVELKGLVRVFDPRTGVCTEVADMGRFSNVVGLCTAAIGNSG
ncbi:unnamed protein product [Urochloa decumbens]|uniref:F-box associated beta-propeller type 3 domain-containing protein n=1 Tax=Urochloa decumbens TaxID=240449 RepID=A0ABC9FJ32_9POAL